MRVTHLTDRYFPAVGGVENHIYNLCKQLASLNIQTEVVSSNVYSVEPLIFLKPEAKVNAKLRRGIRLLPLPEGLGLVTPGMLTEMKGDIFHAHGLGRFPTFLWWIAHSKRRPFVVTTHSDYGRQILTKEIFDAIIPSLSIKEADCIIALTGHERMYLISIGISEEKITVIPNGVDLNELEPIKALSTKHPRTIVFAGRLDVQQKGLDILLEALSLLVRKGHNDVTLYLAGPEVKHSYSFIQKLCSRYGLNQNVRILGVLKRTSLLRLIANSEILVLPSRFEPFGIVILEAMVLGTPVVASSVGGIPEILGDGRFGMLVEPGDPASLAEAIDELLANTKKAESFSKAASEEVKKYTWDRIAIQTASLYKRLLS
ncbi:MAG: glycosyltransferase family 4 protein [Conexivisphaerales archaeon]